MSLFFSLLPLYLFGNLHCAGMCGPLVSLLAPGRFRWLYFLGRLLSFSLAGLLSAELGMFFFLLLNRFHISALVSFLFGVVILIMGISLLFRIHLPGSRWFSQVAKGISVRFFSYFSLSSPYTPFFLGLSTILLPCGQTIVVFSACAINGNPQAGLINGFFFALLTSPALFFAMHTFSFFHRTKRFYPILIGLVTIGVGLLACLRGIADFEWIPHCILNPGAPSNYHIVLY